MPNRNAHRIPALCTGLLATIFAAGSAAAETPSMEEMWRVIQAQQKIIEDLRQRLDEAEQRVASTEEAVEVTADAVEQAAARPPDRDRNRTSIGGYGELHYSRLDDRSDAIGGDDSVSRADLHRFIIYLGHEFSDDLRFFSELEVEHAFVSGEEPGDGEVELEQAWVELDISHGHRLRAGVDILPVGIINTTHEPNTFYGVERNAVESEIIPSTWWEAGLGLSGEMAPGWNYDAVLHTGLVVPVTGEDAFRVREGRLKVSAADDQDVAFTGRLRYTGIPGLELGISGQYQHDITGTADPHVLPAILVETHLDWKHASGLGLRALYARWDMGHDGGLDPGVYGADHLDGWYVEPAYRFPLPGRRLGELGLFLRYSRWDEVNGLPVPGFRYAELSRFVTGFNWWLHPQLVVKFDAQWEDADGRVDQTLDGINLGLGYQF